MGALDIEGMITSLLGGGSESASVRKTTGKPEMALAVATASRSASPTGAGGGDGGVVMGPGGTWSYTTTFVFSGRFDMQLLIKLIKWALEFAENLTKSRKGRMKEKKPMIPIVAPIR